MDKEEEQIVGPQTCHDSSNELQRRRTINWQSSPRKKVVDGQERQEIGECGNVGDARLQHVFPAALALELSLYLGRTLQLPPAIRPHR